VVLSQAGSVLHADQVVADLTTHRTQVTAANRVTGHFVAAPKSAPNLDSAAPAAGGLAALGSSGSATDISANSLELADDTGEAVFQGTVMVSQKGNHLTGERLSIDTNRRRMTMTGPGRVSGTFEGSVVAAKGGKTPKPETGLATVSTGMSGFTDLSASSGEPTNIEADSLVVEDEKGLATFTGKVVVVRGDNRISAGTLNVYYAGGAAGSQLNRITAKDHVVIQATGAQTASGDNLLYEPGRNQLLMTGNVTVSQGGSVVHGEKLVVDLDTGESHFVTAQPVDGEPQQPGAPKPGRIQVLISPEGIRQFGGTGSTPVPAVKPKKGKTGLIGSDVLTGPDAGQ
jgi:lipopolysaccharide export system protein LptA